MDGAHFLPPMLAKLLASLVECIEALTVILAVGAALGWRGALAGTGAALGCCRQWSRSSDRCLLSFPCRLSTWALVCCCSSSVSGGYARRCWAPPGSFRCAMSCLHATDQPLSDAGG